MKVVDNRFICTEKEMKDLVVVDQMFHETCRGLPCSECPFPNKREDCTASLFLHKIIALAKLEKKE